MVVEISWDHSCNEWVAFEFQGVIETKGNIEGAEIGIFQLKEGRPVVIIGNNEVRGEIVTLKTPLCVIKKKEKGEKMEDEPYSEYGIVGIVNKKYLFKSRPVTIVQHVSPPKERSQPVVTS